MSGPSLIEVEAIIRESIGPRAFRAELPNGKEIVAHLDRGMQVENLAEGATVKLEMSPYDFSRGRIVAQPSSHGHDS